MKGIFSSLPRSLAEAVDAIQPECAQFDWAISLQSGPFLEISFMEEDDPRNVLDLFHDFSGGDPAWFKRGILPAHAENLIFDEWSYYLGFNADQVGAAKLHEALHGDISPRQAIFDTIATNPCVYLIFVDDGWWEAYTSIPGIESRLAAAWDARVVDSDRWNGRYDNLHPFPE